MWKLSPDRAAAGTRSSPSSSCLEYSVSDSVVSCLSVHNIQSPVHPHQIKTRLYSLSSLPHRKCLKSEICSCFKMGVIFDSKNFLIVQFCSCNKICQVTHCWPSVHSSWNSTFFLLETGPLRSFLKSQDYAGSKGSYKQTT